jgi:hypothetical protein
MVKREDNRELIQIGIWASIAIIVIVLVVRYLLLGGF